VDYGVGGQNPEKARMFVFWFLTFCWRDLLFSGGCLSKRNRMRSFEESSGNSLCPNNPCQEAGEK